MAESREHQVIIVTNISWLPGQTVYNIHPGPSGALWGYVDLEPPGVTFLVREEGAHPNTWVVMGFVQS